MLLREGESLLVSFVGWALLGFLAHNTWQPQELPPAVGVNESVKPGVVVVVLGGVDNKSPRMVGPKLFSSAFKMVLV